MLLKLFIVHTHHTSYDQTDPFIVIAETAGQAQNLVERDPHFQSDRDVRRRKCGELPWHDGFHALGTKENYPYGVKEVEEVALDAARILWGVFNRG